MREFKATHQFTHHTGATWQAMLLPPEEWPGYGMGHGAYFGFNITGNLEPMPGWAWGMYEGDDKVRMIDRKCLTPLAI